MYVLVSPYSRLLLDTKICSWIKLSYYIYINNNIIIIIIIQFQHLIIFILKSIVSFKTKLLFNGI